METEAARTDCEVRGHVDDRVLGRRIGYWRRRRRMTQAVFADRIGKSKSWVEKAERGERSAGRLSVLDEICEVLQVSVSVLIGEESGRSIDTCVDDSEVGRIRSALERYAFETAERSPADAGSLSRRLDHAWTAFEFADYQVMGRVLPELLEDAQLAHAALGSEESATVLAGVYQVIASTLRKLGEYTLAWLAGDRGVAVAQGAGDLAAVAGAGFRIANALLSMGHSLGGDGVGLLRRERRAALMVDTARAGSQAGRRDEALRRLLAAEETAAPEVRCRPVAQATIADLLHRSRGTPALELTRLAERAGVRP